MTDLTKQGGGEIVEAVAKAIYEAEPIEDQEVDLDGRPTGPVYTVPWGAIVECYGYVHERCLSLARAAIAAARPMILEEAAKVAEDVATCGGVGERGFERIIGNDIAEAIRQLGKDGG